MSGIRITAIHIYPVKSLRGISVPNAAVEPWGLAGDRRWMVTDQARRLVSQRELPLLALISAVPHGTGIRLLAAGHPSVTVEIPSHAQTIETEVWQERVPALPACQAASDWMTRVCGCPCELVYMPNPESARVITGPAHRHDHRVSFADDYPLLLTNEASLFDLVQRSTDQEISMARFRANLVVQGLPAWDENLWREVTIGEVPFAVAGGCERCVVTSVDQTTGERHPANEPIRTLSLFRRNARGRPVFGVNLIPLSRGTITLNASVLASA